MTFHGLFGSRKAIIGMVHLLPLPGSPDYCGDLETVFAAAQRDLSRLTEGGASAAIVENFGDLPYTEQESALTIGAMAILLSRLKREAQIPLGVNVQFNRSRSEWYLAYLTGCAFLRAETFVENRVGPHGISLASAPELMRLKAALPAEALIFADINVKHTFPLAEQPIPFSISAARENGADAVIVSGMQTGQAPTKMEIRQMREAGGDLPLLIGSGITEDNIESCLRLADGVIVGSSIKENGDVFAPVETERVKRLVLRARQAERSAEE